MNALNCNFFKIFIILYQHRMLRTRDTARLINQNKTMFKVRLRFPLISYGRLNMGKVTDSNLVKCTRNCVCVDAGERNEMYQMVHTIV